MCMVDGGPRQRFVRNGFVLPMVLAQLQCAVVITIIITITDYCHRDAGDDRAIVMIIVKIAVVEVVVEVMIVMVVVVEIVVVEG